MPGFDEDAISRDDRGRFSSGGGGGGEGGGSKGPLASWAKAKSEPLATPGEVLSGKAKVEPGQRSWTDKRPSGTSAETWQDHYTGHPDKGGMPTPERERDVHQPIMRAALDKVSPAPAGEKIAIVTMGAPASGKSSGLRNVDSSKFVHVDPDGIKEKLPEYQRATDPRASFRGAAAMVHEESSHIAKRVMSEAAAQGKPVIVDGTGTNSRSMISKIQELKAAGYHVHLAMSHLDQSTGLARAAARAEQTGRHVPESVVKEGYQKVPKNFAEIAKHVDSFQMTDSRRKGSPTVWSKGADGREVHHDPAFVRAFKAEHGG